MPCGKVLGLEDKRWYSQPEFYYLETRMDLLSVMKAGFEDELSKIAGYVRIGKRPLKASTLLSRKVKKGEITKLSAKVPKGSSGVLPKGSGKYLAVGGGMVLGYDQLRKAKRDWETGRAMRLQSNY